MIIANTPTAKYVIRSDVVAIFDGVLSIGAGVGVAGSTKKVVS